MAYELFSRVAFKDFALCKGDVATIVEQHEGLNGRETGYSLEVFNALGETMAVIVVAESKIESLQRDEIFHIRHLEEALTV